MAREEEKIFEDYLAIKNLKQSEQRKEILQIFLNIDKHLTANELYRIVQKKYPKVGYATIYRTLRLLCESGLCRELKFEDGTARYEHLYGHQHHDHLICTKCGRFFEVVDSEIERLQEKLAKQHGFYPERHRMELYGVCRKCKK
ncbi:MAG: transcriptional repressor [Syntrophaceae bacterium CG2_30_49_12]|nr:MAG: transcriptional repressor [Syntrophaceae bacterium CG2_30_49_12]PIP06394.1 MAG: transcriptional repressor [Syntrophobacterales bacterium CG23_combo_of_CG06-09_8_20_14_all_48_27]PJA49767.1 MAG: transcriptional repressor [Syntrophobacterales bacterium CG_4_9_14_3_um_filter_49_8]PJC77019.1 MAG: transcriptional repressor [Syntrophobacterales bacterium CG_4_8_14_3_um_filter_49_14]